MPATTTSDQLLDLIRKSKLVDNGRLDAFLAAADSLPDDPKSLARRLIQDGIITSFQASLLLVGKWRGFQIANGKYKLLELLGIGGMGKVYLCEHMRMKRLVALKVLPTDKLDEPTSLERFEREAHAAGALDHPNIVRAHDLDSDQDGKLHFLVMEYVDGSSLHDIVKKHGPLDVVRACHYISQTAEGLQHAHETAGLIHRDVKPGNILLDRAGTVKLLDMGLARFFNDTSANPITKRFEKSAILGTADYLAPEQAVDSSDVDIRADIYGLGATFYFLLTGKPPFDHGTIAEKLLWHQNKDPEPVQTLRPEVPVELAAVISRMMAKNKMQRYDEPADVVEALTPWTASPIDPPADAEMPRLCPALLAFGQSGLPAVPGGSGSLSGRMRSRVGPRSTAVNRHSTARMRRAVAPPPRRGVVGVAAGLLALAAAIGGLIWYVSQPPDNSRVGPQRSDPPGQRPFNAGQALDALPTPVENTFYVAADETVKARAARRPDVLETLGEALAKSRPNARIVVLDRIVEGQLAIDGAILPNVTIEGRSPAGQPVVWRAAEGAAVDHPLLSLKNPGAAQVRGFVFDGGGKIQSLMLIEGDTSGLRLSECRFTDSTKVPLVVSDASAATGRPLEVSRVRFTSTRDYPDNPAERPAAIQCRSESKQGVHLALNVLLCRIEGAYRCGVQLECAVEADLRLNRWYSTGPGPSDAVMVRVPEARPVKLTMTSNTSAGFSNLLRLDRIPPVTQGSTFLLRSNLMFNGDAFVQAGPGADLAAAKLLFAGSAGNVAVEGAQGGLDVFPIVPIRPKGWLFDPNPDTDRFLRYAQFPTPGYVNPLATAGAGGEPAGVPPLD